MQMLLRIDSSPLPAGVSFSRHLTEEFVEHWRDAHPADEVLARYLNAMEIRPVGAEWIAAIQTPGPNLTLRQQEVLALSNPLITELTTADE